MPASYTECYRLFIRGFAGINEFFASYTVGDRFLKAQKMAWTMKGLTNGMLSDARCSSRQHVAQKVIISRFLSIFVLQDRF